MLKNITLEKVDPDKVRVSRKRMYQELVHAFCESGDDCVRIDVTGKTGMPALDDRNNKVVCNSCNYEIKKHVEEYSTYREGQLPYCLVAGADLFFLWVDRK